MQIVSQRVSELMNQLLDNKRFCRAALAKTGLLNINVSSMVRSKEGVP